jgi:hypothetical protein
MLSRTHRLAILWAVCLIATIGMSFVPPIAQPTDYHRFSDQRTLVAIPNFWNVISNLPFLVVGLIGFIVVLRGRYAGGLASLRVAYGTFCIGVAAVCFGSGYYHWAPSNTTLTWDRLPMAVAFMAFVAIVLGEHISERVAKAVLFPLIALGTFAVWYWDYTERLGRGDLRLYGLVQFLSLAFTALVLILFPSKLSGKGFLWAMFGGYGLAKVMEELDGHVFALLGEQMSGHALKHVAAALGMYALVLALQKRTLTSTTAADRGP